MKLSFQKLILLFLLFSVSSIHAQENPKGMVSLEEAYETNTITSFTPKEMKMLEEVYGEHLEKEVLNNLELSKHLKHLLRNRIVYTTDYHPAKGYIALSEVPLFDVYVQDLKRDLIFDKDSFNPLKYQMMFFTKNQYVYRFGNTNMFIIINKQIEQ